MGPSPLARSYNTDEPKRNNSKTSVLMLRFLKSNKWNKYFGLSLQRCHYKFVIVILIIQWQHDILGSLLNIDSYSSKAKLVALGEGAN